MLTVRIPIKGSQFFNLYANGKPLYSVFDEQYGTLFQFEGTVFLQYGWTLKGKTADHRRSYLVRQCSETKNFKGVYLPNVKEPCAILGIFYGRKIDTARQVFFNLEKLHGKDVYLYETLFYQKLSCLLDGYDGKRTLAINSNLIRLCAEYNRIKGSIV